MKHYYLIAPNIIVRDKENAFTYQCDESIPIGSFVKINVGKKNATGIVIEEVKKPKFSTKDVAEIFDLPALPKELLETAQWISQYYSSHLAQVLQTILPPGFGKNHRKNDFLETLPLRKRTNFLLNKDQSLAVNTILQNKKNTILLHGVTGSGKTQVYIECVKQLIKNGGHAIILVPEISLTPQLVAEFANHFDNLIVTHSRMTDAKRHAIWNKVLSQDSGIIIGPRSALFLPAKNVKAIIIDECHESTYKQDQSPKYNSLRVASVLAKKHDSLLVLGSATPSITDYHLAKNSAQIVSLPKPAAQSTPPVIELVDLKLRNNFTQHRFLSDIFIERLQAALNNKRQALIFHNRRGTSPVTLCESCGWQAQCPNCFMPLTAHTDKHSTICHLCGHSSTIMPSCPECHEPTIIFKGIGTKLIQSEIEKLFPKARVARFDADTPNSESLINRYQDIYDGNIDIIIGTQMLAKGLDIPKLTFVGVIQADSGLALPDFYSEERVFQILNQVIGRAGRNVYQGNAVLQAYDTQNEAINYAISNEYQAFYCQQIAKRKQSFLPPFSHILKLTCSFKTEQGAVNSCKKLSQTLQKIPNIHILGPTPAFHERLGGMFRWQITVKSNRRSQLIEIANNLPNNWVADLDPINLL